MLCCGVVLLSLLAQSSDLLRLNQIQVIGSHNSYHSGLTPNVAALLQKQNPQAADALDYSHPGLDVQLSSGIRQLEIDVFADTKGGLVADPSAPKLLAKAGLPLDAPFDEGIMKKPGFKVIHVQDIDYRSNCQPFVKCLAVIRDWSKAHPGHLPVFVLIETKEGESRADYMVTPEPFTTAVFDALDAEIRSVFSPSEMIVPDDVRGRRATLEEAVLKDGWPLLSAARGKVIFLMDQRKVGPVYLNGHPSLKGRVIFTNAAPGSTDAAFVEVNDPLPDTAYIPSLVRKGYLVRTRTDGDTKQARTGDVTQRDAAMASGAQVLSTDYGFTEKAKWSDYSVSFADGAIARCNPVLKPAGCTLR